MKIAIISTCFTRIVIIDEEMQTHIVYKKISDVPAALLSSIFSELSSSLSIDSAYNRRTKELDLLVPLSSSMYIVDPTAQPKLSKKTLKQVKRILKKNSCQKLKKLLLKSIELRTKEKQQEILGKIDTALDCDESIKPEPHPLQSFLIDPVFYKSYYI